MEGFNKLWHDEKMCIFYVLESDFNGVWQALKAKEQITHLFCMFW